MQCPGCPATMRTISYEGIQIETCPSCEGEWLDGGELRHIVRARETRFNEQERRAVAAAVKITPVDLMDADRNLVCPKCGGLTDARNYGGDSGIIVDRCPECHGIWLDGRELEKIQMLVEGWEDGLPDDLKQFAPRLRQIEREVEHAARVNVSRFRFVNTLINGILDFGME